MPAKEWGWMITPEELESWILRNDERFLVINKPGSIVCHPSKHGPWSSLIGACREYLGVERLHMPSRLDRETSGVMVFAKDPEWGSRLQRAIQHRETSKSYIAVLEGDLREPCTVDQPIGRDADSIVAIRQWVNCDSGAAARTEFEPLQSNGKYTLAVVRPHSGRLHQIRVHAAWMGHAVAADKLYGPDPRLFLEFVSDGFTRNLSSKLPLRRQALHARSIEFRIQEEASPLRFEAALAGDIMEFCRQEFGAVPQLL
jgi:23S rRNA pseudouridine1911/1915/1917 synthase